MHFNTKYIFKGDTEKEIIGKINYNFDQILSFAIGPDGHPGPRGATGIFGPAGKRGPSGSPGIRASKWYKQPTEPSDAPNTNDVWIDNSVSDGNIKIFNYPITNYQWQNSGYSFLNSKYFQSYSYIQGPGGATDKYVIGFKYPGGITGSANTSLLISDFNLNSVKSNPNNSKVVVSTQDQIDRPIMTFSKNGAISDDVPSFYWNSTGNNAGLKFDIGGAFSVTTNNDFSIDSGLARTLITSNLSTFRNNQGAFNVHGDGDFLFASNIGLGVGGFLSITTKNLQVDNSSVNHYCGVTITSPLTSTYILNSKPSSPSYLNGISANIKTSAVIRTFEFEDYTGNAIMYGKPSGSVSSGNLAQTVFGTSGGFTGGTGGPFSYHVRKVKEVRQSTTGLSARQYLTTTTTNLTDVLDMSTNTIWENDIILATPTAYSSVSSSNLGSFKVGDIDSNFNYSSGLDIFGSGFKNSLTGTGVYDAVVNDVFRLTDGSGSTIFAGNFKYYNDQPVKTGSLTNVLGVVKVNADGTMDTTFRANISSAISLVSVTSVNGAVVDEYGGPYGSGLIYIYGCFTHTTNKNGILCLNLDGTLYGSFNSNMGIGINSGSSIFKAGIDPSGTNLFAVGDFTYYKTTTTFRNKLMKIKINGASDGLLNTSFLSGSTSVGPGFVGSSNIPYCFDFLPSGNIIVGGSFNSFNSSTSGSPFTINSVIELNSSNGLRVTTGGFANIIYSTFIASDPIVSSIKYNSYNSYIYIGGSFSKINGTDYGRIARFTITGTTFTLDPTLSSTTGFNDIVYDFAFDGSKVYVGGRFTSYRGTLCPAFVKINNNGSIDPTASIYHNIVSPKSIQPTFEWTVGLVKKMYLSIGDNEFMYVGGFLNSVFSASASNNGIYIKVPSSITQDYLPVYTDGTTTNYRVFLNDPGNDEKLHYIKGLVFDAGLPNAVTSYVDFSQGATGCQYVDLMWVSKTSTANIANPRLFYKNCEGFSGYVDFGANGVYSTAPASSNGGQNVSVTWEFSRQQTGSCNIYKNGTSISNVLINRTISGNGSLPYSIGDKIYAAVSAGGISSGYIGIYAALRILKTSLSTGVTTTEFTQNLSADVATVSNFSNPVTLVAGYSYYIECVAQSTSTGGGCCFVGDTSITMYNGSLKNIDSVIAGDLILTYNVETDQYGEGTVTSIESPIKDDIIEFILSNGTSIKATTEHPFWVIGKGWSSYSPDRTMLDHQMDVSKLSVGDVLLDETGNEVELLFMNDDIQDLQRVYNILMKEGNHTYFANGILVHNKLIYNTDVIVNNSGG